MAVGHTSLTPTQMEWGEGFITPFWAMPSSVTAGKWSLVSSTSYIMYNGFYQVNDADLAQINFDVWLSKGTYTFSMCYLTDPATAICDVLIDGVSKGTIDTYGVGTVYNSLGTVANIVITTSGKHSLSLKVNGKSGSHYYLVISTFVLYRTA